MVSIEIRACLKGQAGKYLNCSKLGCAVNSNDNSGLKVIQIHSDKRYLWGSPYFGKKTKKAGLNYQHII